MVAIHTLLGFVLTIAVVFLAIWQGIWKSQSSMRRTRSILLGLLDLQVLLGLITFALDPVPGWFFIHPLIMVIAVVLAHIYTKESRPAKVRLSAYSGMAVLIVVGVIAGSAL